MTAMQTLSTVSEVIKAAGGRKAVAEMTGVSVKAVAIWRWQGVFPAKTYMVLRDALRTAGFEPSADLFSFIAAPEQENAA